MVIEIGSNKILIVEKNSQTSKYEEEFYKTVVQEDNKEKFGNMKQGLFKKNLILLQKTLFLRRVLI